MKQRSPKRASKVLSRLALSILLLCNIVVWTYHRGVLPPPPASQEVYDPNASSLWLPRTDVVGVQQIVLSGNSFTRGVNAGRLEVPLLRQQELTLVGQLRRWIPNGLIMQSLVLAGITWFKGVEHYFEPWMTDEMYGVAQSAPHEFDYLVDGYTRQAAYHGLHEVGQLMVDQMGDNFGCTVAAIPWNGSWVLGRNFDFEGGRIFDDEKLLKWVFPDQGHAYLSVIWAGMVGAVTGVNDQGLYLSINAAGSRDFARQGTPSTLVLLKALQFSSTDDEAIEIIRSSQMFITDIFVLLDAKRGKLYRIEKSPARTEVIPLTQPAIVTNHLIAAPFVDDPINVFRRQDLTSEARAERGQKLVDMLAASHPSTPSEAQAGILSILRDKGEFDGRASPLGHRRAIDPLIATHSVVYDGHEQKFYVGNGPGASGVYTGFDLKASFATHAPVTIARLPADPLVSRADFENIRKGRQLSGQAQSGAGKGRCDEARNLLSQVPEVFRPNYGYEEALGDLDRCDGHLTAAHDHWKKALAQGPAYKSEVQDLTKKLAL